MKKIFTLSLLLLAATLMQAQTRMRVYFNGGQLTEYFITQIDSIVWLTDKATADDGENTDPSVTGAASDITNYTAVLTGYANNILDNLSSDLKVGIIYCTSGTPSKSNGTQATASTSSVAPNGEYTLKLTNLTPATTYYYRSFVYQSGLWFYGNTRSFTTAAQGVNFTTGDISSLTCFSAKASATVNVESTTNYSSLSYGICYGTSPEPTTSDSKVSGTSLDASGAFTVQLRALAGNTVYCYRPYAVVDGYTLYGPVRTFQTKADNVVTTGELDKETWTVSSPLTIGGGAYSSLVLGVCWSQTNEEPTVSDSKATTNEVNDDNTFTIKISAGVGTIYYRAYVLIDGVAHYGAVKLSLSVSGAANGHDYVDLGLTSGTLWATMNVGATSPEDYGDYFAWGETTGYNSGKTTFNWSTYAFSDGSSFEFTKYCTKSSYGIVDNKTELEPADDAAYVNWGKQWRMPSKAQIKELIDECTWTWTTMNGVNGRLVTGPNGNSIFLPAAGSRNVSSLLNAGELGYYWSRTLDSDDPKLAYYLRFYSGCVLTDRSYRYYVGHSVRPVLVSE